MHGFLNVLTIGLAVSLLTTGVALGQGTRTDPFLVPYLQDYQTSPDASCRKEVLDVSLDFLGFTYVVSPDALNLETTPFRSSQSVIVAPPPALRSVRVFGNNNETGNREKWLIAWRPNPDERDQWLCAWAKPAGLLRPKGDVHRDTFNAGPAPFEVRDLIDDPKNLLVAKAVVHNLQRAANENPRAYVEMGKPEQVEIRFQTAPYGIYAEHRLTEAEAGGAPPGFYYLLGDRTNREVSKLYGWVRAEEFYVQTSLVTVGVDDDQVKIFAVTDPNDPGVNTPDRTPVSGSLETTEIEGRATPKHLVLGTFPDSTDIREALAARQSVKVEEYRVVLPTLPCAEGNCLVQPKPTNIIGDFFNAANADIVFLLDRTRSMKDYFTYAARAIQEFAQTLPQNIGDAQGQVRIAIFSYGDYDPSGIVRLESIRDFTAPRDFSRLSQTLNQIASRYEQTHYDVGGRDMDKLEAPLDALAWLAKNVAWSGASKSRMIIHIFDHGSRDFGLPSKQNPGGFRGKTSIATVVAELNANEVAYYPILVTGDTTNATWSPPARQKAKEQALVIVNEVAQTSTSAFNIQNSLWDTTGESKVQVQGKITAAIKAAWDEAQGLADFSREFVQCLNTSRAEDCALPDDFAQREAERLKDVFLIDVTTQNRKVLAAAEIEAVMAHTQGSIAEFWIRPEGPSSVVPYVRMSPKQLDRTRIVFRDFCNWLSNPEGHAGIRLNIYLSQLASLITDDPVSYSPSDTLAKTLSLPFIERSRYMNKEISQLERLLNADGPDGELVHAFCAASELLRNLDASLKSKSYRVIKGKDAYKYEQSENGVWELVDAPIETVEYEWFVTDVFGNRFTELPFEYFP
ncbi:MAG: vWA domain-containing protein [Paracoccaceae bacterium]|nr:vWA domain-containing protein [Paracoccaceae bacterium]